MSFALHRLAAFFLFLVSTFAASGHAQIRIALLGDQITHSSHRENDPEYPKFLGELLDKDFAIDTTVAHPNGGGFLYGRGTTFQIGSFAHPQATVTDHALEKPKSYLRSTELKLAEAFAPQIVVFGPFGGHEAQSKVSLDHFAKDLRAIFARITAFPGTPKIIVALPIPHAGKDENPLYRRIRTETEQLAREKNLPTIDLWAPFLGHPEFFQDATHLTILGRQHIAKLVAASLVSKSQPPPPAAARVK
jgi:hypothetical protein